DEISDELEKELGESTDTGETQTETHPVLEETFAEIKKRERPRTVTLHDPVVSGFLTTLEKKGDLDRVTRKLAGQTTMESIDDTKNDFVRYALAVGLRSVAPELAEELEDGDRTF
ncbi:MAG: hypothetical protein ABEK59_06715, partial [Halobacteria archaeon]